MKKFNDLDLKKWKELEVFTDSLWIINQRDNSGKHSNILHGNFVPQVARQLILRYSKEGESVIDPFMGSGTTAYEAELLGRNFIGIDLQKSLVQTVARKLDKKTKALLISGDSVSKDSFQSVEKWLKTKGIKKAHLAILHPPYFDIIKFTRLKEDLSNSKNLSDFLNKFSLVVQNTLSVLEKDRYLAVVIGDKYEKGELVPLAFYCLQEVQKLGLQLKGIVVKNMSGNRGKIGSEGIWKYRALASDYFIFKHEYVLIFKNA